MGIYKCEICSNTTDSPFAYDSCCECGLHVCKDCIDDEIICKKCQQWENATDSYECESCENCGRSRIELKNNGEKVCEKCNWVKGKDYLIAVMGDD